MPEDAKPTPKVGDVVWIDEWKGIIGVFEGYDESTKTLHLSWKGCKNAFWPHDEQSFSPVELEDLQILSPAEILARVAWLVKERDATIKNRLNDKIFSVFVANKILSSE